MHLKEMYTNKIVNARSTAMIAITRSGFTVEEAEAIIKSITVPSKERQQWTRWTDEEKNLLCQYRAEGRSLKEIAAALNKTVKQVQSAITRFQPMINSTHYPSA